MKLTDKTDPIIELYVITNGGGAVVMDDFRTVLKGGHLYCFAWSTYNRVELTNNISGYVIRFNKALLQQGDQLFHTLHFSAIYSLVHRNQVIQLDISTWHDGTKLCKMMHQEFKNEQDFKLLMMGSFLSIVLLHLIRKINISQHSAVDGNRYLLLCQFNGLIDEKFKFTKKVSDYAAMLFLTPNYLNSIVKEATGNSASFHIRQRVVMEAIRQIKSRGASLKEVACELGFTDNAHFSKFFKQTAGTNFSVIRKRHLMMPFASG